MVTDTKVNIVLIYVFSPACLPDKFSDFTGARCWTTGWGKDAFGDFGKYQNILKEVDVPIINQLQCQQQLRNTRLGYSFQLHPGFICAGINFFYFFFTEKFNYLFFTNKKCIFCLLIRW